MENITGFDSKEYHSGRLKDFFAPIGLGVTITNYSKFKTEYDRLWTDIFSDNRLDKRRKVYSSRDLAVLFPQEKKKITDAFLDGIRIQLLDTCFFFTIIKSYKVVYSRGWDKKLPAGEFMRKGLNQYPYWCAWKQLQQNKPEPHSFFSYIDEFQGEETLAWQALARSRPRIFYKGDMSNPLIATADVLLDLLDSRLRNNKLEDANIENELKIAGLNGKKQYIGNPDFHNITPISTAQINKEQYRKRPIYYLVYEEKPSLIERKEWEETKNYSRMMDFAIKQAFENDGSVKFYDSGNDYKYLKQTDKIIWCGEKGREIIEGIAKPNGIADIYYSNQEGI